MDNVLGTLYTVPLNHQHERTKEQLLVEGELDVTPKRGPTEARTARICGNVRCRLPELGGEVTVRQGIHELGVAVSRWCE